MDDKEPAGAGERKIDLVQVKIDGRTVPVKGFVQNFIGLAVLGMLSSLRGVTNPREIEITIKVK